MLEFALIYAMRNYGELIPILGKEKLEFYLSNGIYKMAWEEIIGKPNEKKTEEK